MNDERSTFLGTSLLVAAAVFAVAISVAHGISMRRIDDLQRQVEKVEAQLWAENECSKRGITYDDYLKAREAAAEAEGGEE